MKLSLALAAASLASSRPALASVSWTSLVEVTDLSKPLEEAASINKSPGALAVIDAAERDPGTRTAMVVENGMVVASYIRENVEADEPRLATNITGSVTATLLMGIMLDEGMLSSVHDTLGEIFADEDVWEGVTDVAFRKV